MIFSELISHLHVLNVIDHNFVKLFPKKWLGVLQLAITTLVWTLNLLIKIKRPL